MLRILALMLAFAGIALARDFQAGDISIQHPWSRPTMEGMSMGVGYLTLINRGKTADTLVAVSSPAADSVEIHETRMVDGMARMRPRADIALAPGSTVKLEPNGIHLMLVGLRAPLTAGSTLPLTLEFRGAGRVTIEATVENPAAP
jgi:copper(I)-binding protein